MFRVLYVDDEPGLLEIGKFFLEMGGQFSVDIITSAPAALTLLRSQIYDAIISDYEMPRMDGIEFLKEVRSNFGEVPVLLFTGKGREEIVIQAIDNGVDFYVQKGGEPRSQFADLGQKVRVAIERRQAIDQVRDSEQRLADVINFLPDATFAIDTEGQVIIWNKAIEELTGVPAADMLGKGDYEYALSFYGTRRPLLIDLLFEPDETVIGRYYSLIRREENLLIAETAEAHPQGIVGCFMAQASLFYNKRGEVIGAIESIRDITDLRRSRGDLRATDERKTLTGGELPRDRHDIRKKDTNRIRVRNGPGLMANGPAMTGSANQ
jgi:CheY-like chemotaxis protein